MYKFFYELEVGQEFEYKGEFYKKINKWDAENIHTGDIEAILLDYPVKVLQIS
jgi:hypothetical protein